VCPWAVSQRRRAVRVGTWREEAQTDGDGKQGCRDAMPIPCLARIPPNQRLHGTPNPTPIACPLRVMLVGHQRSSQGRGGLFAFTRYAQRLRPFQSEIGITLQVGGTGDTCPLRGLSARRQLRVHAQQLFSLAHCRLMASSLAPSIMARAKTQVEMRRTLLDPSSRRVCCLLGRHSSISREPA
jgi:hypothetical protein